MRQLALFVLNVIVLVSALLVVVSRHDESFETVGPSGMVPRPEDARDEGCVRLDGDLSFQDVVDGHPPGTCYLVPRGVHREQAIVPADGDRFVGESGAVLSGARILRGWSQDQSGRSFVGGQDQRGYLHQGTEMLPGAEADNLPEELFADGERIQRVGTLDELRPGTWYFDYERERIYLGDDPGSYDVIETSVTPFAIAGQGVRDVVVENLVFEKFANPAQFAAVGSAEGERWSHDWTIRHVTARYNHGAGIGVGPGSVVEWSKAHHNGQIGITGDGVDRSDWQYAAPIVIRDSEMHDNLQLGFDWSWEGGAVKVKYALAGSIFERNWVHRNRGPGIWYDIDNYDVVVRDNLVEKNEHAGIFYEISFGETLIEGNVVRQNGGAGIDVSTSRGVTVQENLVDANAHGIHVRVGNRRGQQGSQGDRYDGSDVYVLGNTVTLRRGWTGLAVQDGIDFDPPDDLRFRDNTYTASFFAPRPFRWGGERMSFDSWQDVAGQDSDGRVVRTLETTTHLDAVDELSQRSYGARSGR